MPTQTTGYRAWWATFGKQDDDMTLIDLIFFVIGAVEAYCLGPLWIRHITNSQVVGPVLLFASAVILGLFTWAASAYIRLRIWNRKSKMKSNKATCQRRASGK